MKTSTRALKLLDPNYSLMQCESESNPDKTYNVTRQSEKWACDCRGWTMHMYCGNCAAVKRNSAKWCSTCQSETESVRHDCKHIRTMKSRFS